MRIFVGAALCVITVGGCTSFGEESLRDGGGAGGGSTDASSPSDAGIATDSGTPIVCFLCDDFERTDLRGPWGLPVLPGTGNDMAISAEAARNGKGGLRIRIGGEQIPNRKGILPTTIPAGASRVTLRFSMKVHDSVSVARVSNIAGGTGQSLQIGFELEQLALKLASQKSSIANLSPPVATLEPGKWTTITLDVDFGALKATATAVAEKGTVESGSIDMGPQWGGWDKETLFVRFGVSFLVAGASANLSFDDVALTKQ